MKEIKLNEIDFCKDHILEGILRVTIIDFPIIMNSIFYIIEDEEKFAERMSICISSEECKNQILDCFQIGTKIMIVNPYVRMAVDEKPMIRIDDFKSIILMNETKEKMCRYCGEENSRFNCQRCGLAHYCSKECQIQDLKILNHKLVCKN